MHHNITNKDRQANTLAMLCHLLGFAGFIVPFGNFIGPLIIWLVKKDEYPLVDDQGKESLNYQISIFIYVIVIVALGFAAAFPAYPFAIIFTLPLTGIITILYFAFMIIACIKANEGTAYRYPLTIRFIQ